MIEAFPLAWPHGRPRTERWKREDSKFKATFARARDDVMREVQLLIGRYTRTDIIISTNLPLRRDGIPLANTRQPEDPGVAVYFTYKKRPMSFACDRWSKIEDNMQAISKTIEALRGIARWGTGDMMEAAFTGFTALPAPGQTARPWRDVLNLSQTASYEDAEAHYKLLRSSAHPDRGGSPEAFNAVMKAWEECRKEYRVV